MKPILIIVVFLQFILLTVLSVNYYSTNEKLEQITNLLSGDNILQKAAQPKKLTLDPINKGPPQKNLNDSIGNHFVVLEQEQLAQLIENTVAETLRNKTLISREDKPSSKQFNDIPEKNEQYFTLNDQVSNYIAQGNITPQDFLALSQQMLTIHPKQQQQLLMRLARELNRQ